MYYFHVPSSRIIFFRVLYAATAANLSHPVAFRTYKPRGSTFNPTIVEAICATMATPPYFSPIKCGPRGRQQVFIGGPHGANNPTRELLKEASADIWKGETGRADHQSRFWAFAYILYGARIQVAKWPVGRFRKWRRIVRQWKKSFRRDSVIWMSTCDLMWREGWRKLLLDQWDDLGPIESSHERICRDGRNFRNARLHRCVVFKEAPVP